MAWLSISRYLFPIYLLPLLAACLTVKLEPADGREVDRPVLPIERQELS